MCGIFGSFNRKRFNKLLDVNKQRGTFSLGRVFVTKYDNNDEVQYTEYIRRQEGVHPIKQIRIPKEFKLLRFFGHTQAPTSSNRQWSTQTSHPFTTTNWTVAHNGVITNLEGLKSIVQDVFDVNTITVDSMIVPVLLETVDNFTLTPVHVTSNIHKISDTLSLIEGTFALILYHSPSRQLYIARQGSTLYGNLETGDFSSIKTNSVNTLLDEGIIYQVTEEGIATVGSFQNSSPFFTL